MKHPTQIEDRRNWKGQTVDFAAIQAYEFRECQYCLTDAQVAVLGGVIEFLAWDTRWIGIPDDDESREWILQFRNDIQRRLMMSCCGDEAPNQFRYTITGVLQISTDQGATWSDAPQFDPRINSTQFPPPVGEDVDDLKCIAATGAAALLKEQVGDQLTDDMARFTLSELISTWVGTLIDSSNPFEALVTVISNQVFALVIATLRPALTDPVYETFKCILLCRMLSDASFDYQRWGFVRSDITDQIGGIAGIFLEHLVYLLGSGGLTNLVRAGGAAEGDCDDCDACPSNCAPTDWRTGLYYDGSWHTPRGGTIIETGEDYLIIESMDRGDGQSEISISTADLVTPCTLLFEWVGTTPSPILGWYGIPPQTADYFTWTRNDLQPQPVECTGFYLQMQPGPWQLKVTFL